MGSVPKGPADYYAPGDWNIRCSMCHKKLKASEAEQNWQGQWRCPEHNEPRQPQDFVRGVKEDMSVPFVQPTQISYVSIPYSKYFYDTVDMSEAVAIVLNP